MYFSLYLCIIPTLIFTTTTTNDAYIDLYKYGKPFTLLKVQFDQLEHPSQTFGIFNISSNWCKSMRPLVYSSQYSRFGHGSVFSATSRDNSSCWIRGWEPSPIKYQSKLEYIVFNCSTVSNFQEVSRSEQMQFNLNNCPLYNNDITRYSVYEVIPKKLKDIQRLLLTSQSSSMESRDETLIDFTESIAINKESWMPITMGRGSRSSSTFKCNSQCLSIAHSSCSSNKGCTCKEGYIGDGNIACFNLDNICMGIDIDIPSLIDFTFIDYSQLKITNFTNLSLNKTESEWLNWYNIFKDIVNADYSINTHRGKLATSQYLLSHYKPILNMCSLINFNKFPLNKLQKIPENLDKFNSFGPSDDPISITTRDLLLKSPDNSESVVWWFTNTTYSCVGSVSSCNPYRNLCPKTDEEEISMLTTAAFVGGGLHPDCPLLSPRGVVLILSSSISFFDLDDVKVKYLDSVKWSLSQGLNIPIARLDVFGLSPEKVTNCDNLSGTTECIINPPPIYQVKSIVNNTENTNYNGRTRLFIRVKEVFEVYNSNSGTDAMSSRALYLSSVIYDLFNSDARNCQTNTECTHQEKLLNELMIDTTVIGSYNEILWNVLT